MKKTKLFPGARVALICPSSPIDAQKLNDDMEAVRKLGLVPVAFDTATAKNGYLAGSDEQRANDVNAAFADYTIDGVMCLRGGYGVTRMLDKVDFAMIERRPKYFSGYSDITGLLNTFTQRCGFVTHHAMMPHSDYRNGCDEYSLEMLKNSLFGRDVGVLPMPEGAKLETYSSGACEGELCGGNLAVLTYLLGTPWDFDVRGKILFIEDVHEKPYRIDSYLTHLKNAGKLNECKGIIMGYFTDCGTDDAGSLTMDEVFDGILGGLDVPILKGFPCGHDKPFCTLPIGAQVRLDADAKTVEILE